MKKSKRVYAKPIEENGTINAFSTAANVDWIRSARLQKKVDAGDTEAKEVDDDEAEG